MLSRKSMQNVAEKCDIYFEGSIISKELLIRTYADFIASTFAENDRIAGVVLHSGSVCFDVISVLAAVFGSLILDGSDAEDILSSLNEGDMVQYRNSRYYWGGFGKLDEVDDFVSLPDIENATRLLLIQRKPDKHLGEIVSKTMLPLAAKNRIVPYNGNSQITDGRGLRRVNTNRAELIAYLFGVPLAEIPSVPTSSSIIVAERDTADRIVKGLTISYDHGKTISLLDFVTASYFTDGDEYPYAGNPGRNDPVLKFTGKISTARELILDKNTNKAIGMLVLGSESILKGRSELPDLLNRKSLQYIYLSADIDSGNAEEILSECEGASIFACTKEFLLSHSLPPKEKNRHTAALDKQVQNIVNKEIEPVILLGACSWGEYRAVKEYLNMLRQYDWNAEEKDLFVINAYSLLNLFTTAVFPMKRIEVMVDGGVLNGRVVSPRQRLNELKDLADKFPTSIVNHTFDVIGFLERLYGENEIICSKHTELKLQLSDGAGKRIAVIVPKAYYSEVLAVDETRPNENVTVVTANRFDNSIDYDEIIVIGDFSGKRFDVFKCRSAPHITVLLYEFESRLFSHREKTAALFEYELNKRTGIASEDEDLLSELFDINRVQSDDDREISEFKSMKADLDYFIDKIGGFDIKTLIGQASASGTAAAADVVAVGIFLDGGRILFSKYYKAFVFDIAKGTVTETDVEKLEPGDMLVFTRRDDFTRNMVDNIFENLLSSGRLNESIKEAAFKSAYWKQVLREYMDDHNFSYREVSKNLSAKGCKRHEVTIRAWLSDDCRIIGPFDEEAFTQIAELTADPYMKSDPKSFCEACRIMRHERRETLHLVGQAIIDKLNGHLPEQGGLLEVVYDNVDKLTVMLELKSVTELEEPLSISTGMINKPLMAQEV